MAQIAPLHNGGRTFDKSGDVSKRKSNLGHTEKVRREVTTTWHADIRGMPSSSAARLLGIRMATNFQGNLPICPPSQRAFSFATLSGTERSAARPRPSMAARRWVPSLLITGNTAAIFAARRVKARGSFQLPTAAAAAAAIGFLSVRSTRPFSSLSRHTQVTSAREQ